MNEELSWFEYRVRSHPHHTDYAGVVWHGTYIAWMEEARVECLRSRGFDFTDVVAWGLDLPVVELCLRYHRSIRMGMEVIVKTRMSAIKGVRLIWDYQICSADGPDLYVTGKVTLVAIDREKGKIMRQMPPELRDALEQLSA